MSSASAVLVAQVPTEKMPQFWPALALALFALLCAGLFFFTIERLGHARRSVLLTEFNVTAPANPDRAAERPTMYNEFYRHRFRDVRSLVFKEDLSRFAGTFDKPTLLVTDAFAFIEVRLNGTLISDQGARDGPLPDRAMEPRLYYLPDLKPGQPAVLAIQIEASDATPLLREVFLADRHEAVGAYRTRRFVAIEGVVAATSIAVFAGLLAISVTPLLQRRSVAWSFSGVMLLWAIRNAAFAGPISDMPWVVYQGIYFASTFLILMATVFLINAWTFDSRLVRRYFAPGLGLLLLLLSGIIASGIPGSMPLARDAGSLIGASCFALMIGQVTVHMARLKDVPWAETFLFLICLWVGIVELLGDANPGATRLFLPETGLSMAYGPLMPLPLAAGMLINFVRQTIRMQRHLQSANATLSSELVLREKEIAKVYQQREAEAQETARHLERQRIMQDMHDGIGSHLLGLLLQVRSGKMDRETLLADLERSLDDLHLVVESLGQTSETLEEAIGAFRTRLQAKCEAAGIQLHWEISETQSAGHAGPAKVLQIYRILQEAASNAIRHGSPKNLTLRTGADPIRGTSVRIELEDDGNGFDLNAVRGRGRGLGNMHRRAASIPASLEVESRPGATIVRLSVPLPQDTV